MAIRLIDNSSLLNLADAIRDGCRLDPAIKMPPSEMEGYIRSYTPDFTFSTEKFTERWSLDDMVGAFIPATSSSSSGKYANNALIMAPVRGNNSVNLWQAYYNCQNLFGQPVCGDKVTDMSYAYAKCINLTGHPVCGPNVVNMDGAYNKSGISGQPVCGPNVVSMCSTYTDCHNLTGQPVCGPNVVNMPEAYAYCYNLTGNPVCGPNVVNMTYTYANCHNLTGNPVCGPNVVSMRSAYMDCYNLTGNPVCGPNVFSMAYAYYNCYNLTGQPVCSPNVTNMQYAYYNCYNLTGQPVIGPNVVTGYCTFFNCWMLNAEPIISSDVDTNMDAAFRNCYNLTGDVAINVVGRIHYNTTNNQPDGRNWTTFNHAFANCKLLNSVTFYGIGEPGGGNNFFNNSNGNGVNGMFEGVINVVQDDIFYPNGELIPNPKIDRRFNIFLSGPNTQAINTLFLDAPFFSNTTAGKQFMQFMFKSSTAFTNFYNTVFDEPINIPKIHVYSDETGNIVQRTEYVPCYYQRTIDYNGNRDEQPYGVQIRIYAEYPGYFNT